MSNLFEKFKEKQAKFRDFQERSIARRTESLKKRNALERQKTILAQERAKRRKLTENRFSEPKIIYKYKTKPTTSSKKKKRKKKSYSKKVDNYDPFKELF